MKRWIISSMLIFSMASFSMALAEGDKLSGEVSATGMLTSVGGNNAKFNEYRDVRDGVYGDVKLKYESEKNHVDLNAQDMGYDTQRYSIRGGVWGDFKFDLNYDELPHNITYDAKTLYSGAGTSNLTYPTHPPSTDTNTWNIFDYSTKRKSYSGGFQVDKLKPFFFDASASSERKTGIYPLGAAGTTREESP